MIVCKNCKNCSWHSTFPNGTVCRCDLYRKTVDANGSCKDAEHRKLNYAVAESKGGALVLSVDGFESRTVQRVFDTAWKTVFNLKNYPLL